MGIFVKDETRRRPDRQVTTYAGRQLAEAIGHIDAFAALLDIACDGGCKVADLVEIGPAVAPGAIEPGGREQQVLRSVVLGTDDATCQGQQPEGRLMRSRSLRLMLDFVRSAEGIESDFVNEFRWSCYTGVLPESTEWSASSELADTRRAWAAYQRNELFNYALENLLYAVLVELDREPQAVRSLARRLAASCCAPVADARSRAGKTALTGSVESAVNTCRDSSDDHWGDDGTWALAQDLIEAGEPDACCGLAARLLLRLASEPGDYRSHPFDALRVGTPILQAREIHFPGWLKRVGDGARQPAAEFFEDVIVEWVIFRHLRVATRKLAAQGVATFKLRPEDGRLLLSTDEIPLPTFTSPRVRQAQRFLADLGLLHIEDGATSITKDGLGVLS